jgi:hypothetical protein
MEQRSKGEGEYPYATPLDAIALLLSYAVIDLDRALSHVVTRRPRWYAGLLARGVGRSYRAWLREDDWRRRGVQR